MKIHAALAAAAILAVPAVFAQSTVQSSTGATVTSGTGAVVTPGVSSSTTVIAPIRTVEVLPQPTINGAVLAQAGSTETVNGNTKTVTTRYWVNVPRGAMVDDEFERWQRLR
jgi:dihydroxyacetone kinase-like predicted kinase